MMHPTAHAVGSWIERYVRAWETNDAADIGDLFTDDAEYLTAPFREPWRGREGIVEGWLGGKDTPGSWRFSWHLLAVGGGLAFVQGRTEYHEEGTAYANLWVIRLEGERCSSFTEWWMLERG